MPGRCVIVTPLGLHCGMIATGNHGYFRFAARNTTVSFLRLNIAQALQCSTEARHRIPSHSEPVTDVTGVAIPEIGALGNNALRMAL